MHDVYNIVVLHLHGMYVHVSATAELLVYVYVVSLLMLPIGPTILSSFGKIVMGAEWRNFPFPS